MQFTPKILWAMLLLVATHQSAVSQIQKPLPVASEAEIDSKTYTGIISEQYTNGRPSLWKTKVNGKTEGLWLEWYPDGTLRYRAYWKNNLGNGRWEYFHPNGQLRSESFYINDITQGIYRAYHENGALKYDATYLNGKKDGLEFTYDVNGAELSKKRFEQGVERIDEPRIFEEGTISIKNGNEWGITFMPDGNAAYFTRRDLTSGKKRIYYSTKTESGWSTPIIAPFSDSEDEGAFINRDGSTLFFASYRPLPDGSTSERMDMNIWYVNRANTEWSTPSPVSGAINMSMKKNNVWPANYEAGPMTDTRGNLYFWTKGAKTKGSNLYLALLKNNSTYGTPQELIPPSSNENFDTSPYLSPDGNILFFASDDRYDGYGGGDIYYSVKKNNRWSIPKNLGPVVNSYQSEGSPSFSPDGRFFYFSSNRGDLKDANGENIWNLYYMESKYLMIEQ